MKLQVLSYLIGCLACLQACTEATDQTPETYRASAPGAKAADPYLTLDHRGNAVLCWTEKESGAYILKYAVYDEEKTGFGKPVPVSPSAGTRISPESMNKVAFKSDGSVVAVFGKKFEDQKNPFASGILYSISRDHGKSWSAPEYLHSDTSHHYGRGFFDLAALPDGEIGAVWLDSRPRPDGESSGRADTGSALFFARTEKDTGFAGERQVCKNTCECCRTDLLCDQAGVLHLAWRGILYPPISVGETGGRTARPAIPDIRDRQVRDMLYAYSTDTGKTFSTTGRLSKDNWEIEGCPHTGPSLAVNEQGVHAIWFTAGDRQPAVNRPGIYHTLSPAPGKPFQERALLSRTARHPQMAALPDGTWAVVLEESPAPTQPERPHTHSPGHAAPAEATSIILKRAGRQAAGSHQTAISITDGKQTAHHPVILALDNGLLLAWVQKDSEGSSIYWAYITNV